MTPTERPLLITKWMYASSSLSASHARALGRVTHKIDCIDDMKLPTESARCLLSAFGLASKFWTVRVYD
jgi:hypothetical protein